MKKKALKRGLLGFPLGVAIGHGVTIIISLIMAGGYYSAAVPGLIETMGSEISAVVLQAILTGLLGAGFAAASVIWEIDDWSIAKQTGIYFLLVSLLILPIAYITHWMEHSVVGFVTYYGIFIVLFLLIWGIQYILWKKNIDTINQQIKQKKQQ